jgi:hypothetical protein
MKHDRNTTLAVSLLAEGGLTVSTVVQGRRHVVLKIVGGERLIISRGARQDAHMAWLIKRDIKRLLHARTVTAR